MANVRFPFKFFKGTLVETFIKTLREKYEITIVY